METCAHVVRTAYYNAFGEMLATNHFKEKALIIKMTASEAAMDNTYDVT